MSRPLPPLIATLAACASTDEARAALRPYYDALPGFRDAEAIVEIELARWLTHHMMGHPIAARIHALLGTTPIRHDVGYYADDAREPLKLRTCR